jgi:hypothetical protein
MSAASNATSGIVYYIHHFIPNGIFYDPNKRRSQREDFTPGTKDDGLSKWYCIAGTFTFIRLLQERITMRFFGFDRPWIHREVLH